MSLYIGVNVGWGVLVVTRLGDCGCLEVRVEGSRCQRGIGQGVQRYAVRRSRVKGGGGVQRSGLTGDVPQLLHLVLLGALQLLQSPVE